VIQQPGPSHAYAKERRETLPLSPSFAKSCPAPTLTHRLLLPQPAPAAHFLSVIRGCRLAGHLVSKAKYFLKDAFLSACGNVMITVTELTTQSLDIIKRLDVFSDALTGLHA